MNPRIDLRLYAAITVGEHVGVPRPQMLSLVNMTEPDWEAERAAWSRVIAARLDDDDEAFQQQHDAAILDARHRFGRTVEPLESDSAAWGAFLGQWSRATEPAAWLESIALTWLDVARLQGIWSGRLAESEPLRKAMLQHMVGEPPPLPPLVIGPWPVARAFAGLEVPVPETSTTVTNAGDDDEGVADVAIFEPLPRRTPPSPGRSSDRLKR